MIEAQLHLSISCRLIVVAREYDGGIVKSNGGSPEGRAPRWDSLRLSHSGMRPLKRP